MLIEMMPRRCSRLNTLLALRDKRITAEGVLVIKAQSHRTQDMNRLDAYARLQDIVQSVALAPKPRRATRPTHASPRRASPPRCAGRGGRAASRGVGRRRRPRAHRRSGGAPAAARPRPAEPPSPRRARVALFSRAARGAARGFAQGFLLDRGFQIFLTSYPEARA
jgi:hypothetical protein